MNDSLREAAQSYVRSNAHINRPYRGLNLTVGQTEFIEAMRKEGFVHESESELIEAFGEAKKQVHEFFKNYF